MTSQSIMILTMFQLALAVFGVGGIHSGQWEVNKIRGKKNVRVKFKPLNSNLGCAINTIKI